MAALSRKTRILVTGASGQLGQALREESLYQLHFEFTFLTKKELDITSIASIDNAVKQFLPDVIINTAAYTAVDLAETEKEKAFEINGTAVAHLAQVSKLNNIALIHISTDYVFDGLGQGGYTEGDNVAPQTCYGASKRSGEEAIISLNAERFVIIRTSWLYSVYGHNFLKTMLRLGQERTEVSVVNDQYGIPTLANDLAKALLKIIPQLNKENSGVYHYSNSGETSWFDFAQFIFAKAQMPIKVNPVASTAFPIVARRPKFSVLNTDKIKKTFGVAMPSWQSAAGAIVEILSNK